MKKKTYVLMLSKCFPATHPRIGEPTNFRELLLSGIKIHTIRRNYELWRKRFEEINAGNAILSIRQWTNKPYTSKQVEIARLTKDDGIGLEKVTFGHSFTCVTPNVNDKRVAPEVLAKNDGLSFKDWSDWFGGTILQPMAIIHFTSFRYQK